MTQVSTKTRELGKALDSYMRFRAEQKGVGYELNPEFYETRIRSGISAFFGVTFADDELLGDRQQPKIFKQWKKLTTKSYVHDEL
jgi:hypothetical protein